MRTSLCGLVKAYAVVHYAFSHVKAYFGTPQHRSPTGVSGPDAAHRLCATQSALTVRCESYGNYIVPLSVLSI